MRHRGVRLLLALAALPCGWGTAVADNAQTPDPADADLLEFLGTVDSGADSQAADDGSWIDYLSQTDIGKVAKTADPNGDSGAKPSSPGAQAPVSGGKKDDQ
jgi:hypothetical protein